MRGNPQKNNPRKRCRETHHSQATPDETFDTSVTEAHMNASQEPLVSQRLGTLTGSDHSSNNGPGQLFGNQVLSY
jgi:hypothetical protein